MYKQNKDWWLEMEKSIKLDMSINSSDPLSVYYECKEQHEKEIKELTFKFYRILNKNGIPLNGI